MINIAKLSAETAKTYYREDYSSAGNQYYSEGGNLEGKWQGELAAKLGLVGAVDAEHFDRLADGQHPFTGEQLVKHRSSAAVEAGKEVAHLAAYDIVFRPGKSIALAGLVGGDRRLIEVVRAANDKAIAVLEGYIQQRMGGNNLPETTRQWIVATFEHDTARPVDGYPAPLIHHHNIVMNMTCADPNAPDGSPAGQARSLWSREFYKAQTLGESVYQSEIAKGARELGYKVQRGPTGSAEVGGFSKEYLDAESARSKGIQAKLAALGMEGSIEAAKIVAKDWREKKLPLTPEQVRAVHQAHGEAFGDQAKKVVDEALERGPQEGKNIGAEEAVEFAKKRLSERSAVFEHYEVLRDAIRRGHGSVSFEDATAEVHRRIGEGGLIVAEHVRPHAPEARYTTPELAAIEQAMIARMHAGKDSVAAILPGADLSNSGKFADNPLRLRVLEGFLTTKDQITALNGAAGSAKSTSLKILADIAARRGFIVQGLAPTGAAVDSLSEKGMRAKTLQRHLLVGDERQPGETRMPRLYLLDEASLVSARQMHAFLGTLQPQDHAILIGDDAPGTGKVGQHTSVEAGRPFWELQMAGMKSAHVNKIYRQKEESLKQVVLQFRGGATVQALNLLNQGGGIHVVGNRQERFAAIGKWFAADPASALVVSPDNDSQRSINAAVRGALQDTGHVGGENYEIPVLVGRDVTGEDRTRAENYKVGDALRYMGDNRALGVKAKSYGTVIDLDAVENKLTVRTADRRTIKYDPARTGSGVSVFEQRIHKFSVGEHVQFTAPDKKLGVTNRNTGFIKSLDKSGNIEVQLKDNGKAVRWNLRDNRHLDYGYSSTSHASQSRTVERAAVQVDTGDYRLHKLLNRTFSYVAGSRPEYELAVFTDNKDDLVKVMGREHEVHTALTQDRIMGRTVAAAVDDVTEQRAPAAAPRIAEDLEAAAVTAARSIDTGIAAS